MKSIIVAMTVNRTIGKNGTIPWRCSPDMKRFKEITSGGVVVMGRKTFESIGSRPLKNRVNIVITSKPDKDVTNELRFVKTFQDAVDLSNEYPDRQTFFIGGQKVYEEALKIVDKIYLTLIGTMMLGDAKFPELPLDYQWRIKVVGEGEKGKDSDYSYSFMELERI